MAQEMLALIKPENIEGVRTLPVTLALSQVPQLNFTPNWAAFKITWQVMSFGGGLILF